MGKKLRLFGTLVSAVAATSALAAGQGSLGTTSTANFTFTATAPPPPRNVQVLGVQDVNLDSNTGLNAYGNFGVTDTFCVVDTTGGALSLQVSTSRTPIAAAQSWALQAMGGAQLAYRMYITGVSTTNPAYGGTFGGTASSFTAAIPAGVAVTDSASCGSGNIRKHVEMRDATSGAFITSLPATGLVYTDTITMLLSPQ